MTLNVYFPDFSLETGLPPVLVRVSVPFALTPARSVPRKTVEALPVVFDAGTVPVA